MAKLKKPLLDKLKTKLRAIDVDPKLKILKTKVLVLEKVLFHYSGTQISYTNTRYYPSRKEDLVEEDFEVLILLSHESFKKVLTTNIVNPPKGVKKILVTARNIKRDLNKIVIGSDENKIQRNTIYLTNELYSILTLIEKEEGREKVERVRERSAPFLKEYFNLISETHDSKRDYSLLLRELLVSHNLNQIDIVNLLSSLKGGVQNEVAIRKQITKQVQWLLEAIQKILDEPNLSSAKAKDFGYDLFGFTKSSIKGPEHLMEKILTAYGRNVIFGVPALLNTNKYVTSAKGSSNSQFDIVLVTSLSDVEVVELKRTDEILLDYDYSRGKFYQSKALSVATAQAERYISTMNGSSSIHLKIEGKTIEEFIQSQIGAHIELSICRPRALIIIGQIHKIVKPHGELSVKMKRKVSEQLYLKRAQEAYKEIKSSYKNIDIVTYSELVEGARLRLEIEKGE